MKPDGFRVRKDHPGELHAIMKRGIDDYHRVLGNILVTKASGDIAYSRTEEDLQRQVNVIGETDFLDLLMRIHTIPCSWTTQLRPHPMWAGSQMSLFIL